MTRVLVTGGAGFIGRNLVIQLQRRGCDLTVLDNRSSSSPLPDINDVAYIDADVSQTILADHRYDFIYHLASKASPPRYLADPIGTMRSNAEGTRLMLDLARRSNATFLFASTSEIYGEPLEHPQTETTQGIIDVTSTRSVYDESKRYGETLTHTYRRHAHVDTRVARIFNTYGHGMRPDDGRLITNLLSQAIAGEPLTIYGDGTQTRSFCFITDLVDGLIRLAESNVTDPINLGNPTEYTVNEFADHIARYIGDTGRIYHPLPESDPTRRRPDISKAQELLGWEPHVDLSYGVAYTARYLDELSRQVH